MYPFDLVEIMESSSTTPRIVELAAKISSSVSQLQELLSAQGVPSPSFTEDSPERLPANTFDLQDAVLDATTELHELLMEPVRLIFRFCAVRAPGTQLKGTCQANVRRLQTWRVSTL
jgi:hypothetical protein